MTAGSDQDWVGFVVVIAMVLLAVAADYSIARVLLWWDTRANHAASQSLRAIAVERCTRCGCPMRAGHEPASRRRRPRRAR